MRFIYLYKRIFASIAFFVAIAAVFAVFLRGREEVIILARADVVEEMTVPGRVVSADAIQVGFPFDSPVAYIYAKKGEIVSAGNPLFRLDTTDAEAELAQLLAKTDIEKLKLSQILAGVPSKEIAFFESKAEEARVALESARKKEEDEGFAHEAVLKEQYALAADYGDTVLLNAENALKALEGIYDEKNTLLDIFLVPESPEKSESEWQMRFARTALENIVFDAEKLKTASARADIDLGISRFKTNLEVLRSLLQKTAEILDGARTVFGAPDAAGYRTTVAVQRSVINATQTALITLEQNIAAEKAKGQITQNSAAREIAQRTAAKETADRELALKRAVPQEVAAALARAQIKEYALRISFLRERITKAIVYAPVKGVLDRLYVLQGVAGKAGSAAVSLTPFSGMQIEILAQDMRIFPKIGDHALIFISGKDVPVKGSVGEVSDGKVRVYAQEETANAELSERVSVQIRAVIKENALMVPAQFIFEENGFKKAYLRGEDGKKSTAIFTGIVWKDSIEILEGVSEGDNIVKP